MSSMKLGVRMDVIFSLQRRVLNAKPGSLAAEVSEYAILLALSPRRTVRSRENFERSVCRDAFRILVRRNKRHPLDSLDEIIWNAEDGTSGSHEPQAPFTQEEELLGAEMETRIRQALTADEALCFDDLLRGATVDEVAQHLTASQRTAKRCTQRVRQIAAFILGEA